MDPVLPPLAMKLREQTSSTSNKSSSGLVSGRQDFASKFTLKANLVRGLV